MGWRYEEPRIEDYESEEAYEEALCAYENALELYQEMFEETYRDY
jgi:hypothetical protein